MDIWESLIGAPPQGPEETQRIAQQLRRNAEFGLLGQLTGDRVLAPTGQSMREMAFKKAGSLQKARQFGMQQDLVKGENALTRTMQQRHHGDRMQLERDKLAQQKQDQNKMMLVTRPEGTLQWFNPYTTEPIGEPFGSPQADPRELDQIYKDVERLGNKAMEYQPTLTTMAQIDKLLQPYVEHKDGTLVPTQNVPGIGRGQIILPSFMRSEEGNMIFGRIQELRNIILMQRSGAAVTPHEAERLDAATQLLKTANERDFLNQYLKVRDLVNESLNGVYASYRRPGVVETYIKHPPYGTPVLPLGPWGQETSGQINPGRDFEAEYGLGGGDAN